MRRATQLLLVALREVVLIVVHIKLYQDKNIIRVACVDDSDLPSSVSDRYGEVVGAVRDE
jgi:hypothetical protein